MPTMVENALRYATRNLTGNREADIAFLKKQNKEYYYDSRVSSALERILKCLMIPEASTAAA